MAMGSPDSRHYLGAQGERERFLRQSPDYDLLHLSVHATGNPQRLYDNYLYETCVGNISLDFQKCSNTQKYLHECHQNVFLINNSFSLDAGPCSFWNPLTVKLKQILCIPQKIGF